MFSSVFRLFTPKIAEFYENYYKSKGVNFIKGTVLSSFENDSTGKVMSYSIKMKIHPNFTGYVLVDP